MLTWNDAYMQLGITKEDIRFYYLITQEKYYTMCSIAEASDVVEGEQKTSNHSKVMQKAVKLGEKNYLPDCYDILDFHAALFPYGGEWRTTNVFFRNCEECPPEYGCVPGLMRRYVEDAEWWLNYSKENEYVILAHLHIEFEHIHPVTDGNGRLGRILLNCYAAYLNLPMIKITRKDKCEYVQCIEDKNEEGLARLLMACSV